MSFSTRQNPRLAQSGVALTSLGAVGGARGTAAGALRIFVEFLTTYDKKAIAELEGDLAEVEKKSKFAAAEDEHRLRKLASVRQKLRETEFVYNNKLDATARKQVRAIEALQGVRTKAGRAELAERKANLQVLLGGLGLTKQEIDLINNRTLRKKEEAKIQTQIDAAEQRALARSKQRVVTETQLGKVQQARSTLAPKLAGLAIGAVGGILGGAVLGVGFALAEEGIARVGDALQDLIDPARHAKEEVKELAKQVNELASNQNISTLQAAKQFVQNIGINPQSERGTELSNLLAELATRQKIIDALDQQNQLQDAQRNKAALDEELRQKVTDNLRKSAEYRNEVEIAGMDLLGNATIINHEYVGALTLEEAVKQRLNQLTGDLANNQLTLANNTALAAANAANAAALWNVYADSLANALNQALAVQQAPLDAKIESIQNAGPSKRTRQLEAAVEKAQSAGSGGDGGYARRRELANIAEERAIILLRMRLKLMGTNINLEKYSGKFLLEAINAKIAALQKEGEAQQRVNQLLDIQYRLSRQTERNQGESIQDFLERRAQEQRGLLAERDDLERQSQIDALEQKRDNLQDQLDLEELAERKRDALRTTGTNNHLKNLQKQLEASRKADAKARADRIKALEQQKKDQQKAVAEAIALTSAGAQAETLAAIKGMKNLEDIGMFSGRMAGLMRAKSSIQALVDGFGLPKAIAAPFIQKLNGLIEAASGQMERVYRNQSPRGNRSQPFAKGGVFMLNNANNPFGANTRTGEEGTEVGIILSHQVAEILKKQKPGVESVGPIYISRSDDPYGDAYRVKRAVREGVEAALG